MQSNTYKIQWAIIVVSDVLFTGRTKIYYLNIYIFIIIIFYVYYFSGGYRVKVQMTPTFRVRVIIAAGQPFNSRLIHRRLSLSLLLERVRYFENRGRFIIANKILCQRDTCCNGERPYTSECYLPDDLNNNPVSVLS